MSTWIIYIIAAVVLCGGYIYTLKSFGDSRYDAGRADERTAMIQVVKDATEYSRQQGEAIDREVEALPDSDLIDAGRLLGILRRPQDR